MKRTESCGLILELLECLANDGQTDVWYSILSSDEGQLKLKHYHFSYDHVLANQLMTEKGLPASYAKHY